MKVSNVNYFMTGHILEQRGVSSFIYQRIMGWILVVIYFYDYRRVGIHVFFLCKDHTLFKVHMTRNFLLAYSKELSK